MMSKPDTPADLLRRVGNVVAYILDKGNNLIALLAFVVGWVSRLSPTWLAIVVVLFLAVLLVRAVPQLLRPRIRLSGRWQALAWTHYRELLAHAMVESAGADGRPRLDFVTYSGEQFWPFMHGSALLQFQYRKGSSRQIDLVVFDIEHLDELKNGVTFPGLPDPCALVEIESFAGIDRHLARALKLPAPFSQKLRPLRGHTYALPLRWGVTGIAVKIGAAMNERLKAAGIDFESMSAFDLALLLNDDSTLRRHLSDPSDPFWVMMLDWYLPGMLVLALDESPTGYARLEEPRFKSLVSRLEKLRPLMHPQTPLSADPVDLRERVHRQTNVIIIGGGNWLEPESREPGSVFRVLPIKNGSKQIFLIWCECVGLLASRKARVGTWRTDANRLLAWIAGRSDLVFSSAASPAYRPSDQDRYATLSQNGTSLVVREAPPKQGNGVVPREKWEAEWSRWRAQLQTA